MSTWLPPVFGPLPGWLAEPVRLALHDLQGAAPIALEVGFDERAGDHVLWVRETDNGHVTGVGLGGARGAELAVHIADELIEQVFPESDGAWGEARPPCPGHTHPASPALLDGEAWWTCPRDGTRIAPFGALPTA